MWWVASAGAYIKAAGGLAALNITLPGPTDLYRLYFRGSWNKGSAKVSMYHTPTLNSLAA